MSTSTDEVFGIRKYFHCFSTRNGPKGFKKQWPISFETCPESCSGGMAKDFGHSEVLQMLHRAQEIQIILDRMVPHL